MMKDETAERIGRGLALGCIWLFVVMFIVDRLWLEHLARRPAPRAAETHDRMLFWLCLAAGFVCAAIGG